MPAFVVVPAVSLVVAATLCNPTCGCLLCGVSPPCLQSFTPSLARSPCSASIFPGSFCCLFTWLSASAFPSKMSSVEVDMMWEDSTLPSLDDCFDDQDLLDPKVPSLTNSCSSLPCPCADQLPYTSEQVSTPHSFTSPLQELPGFPPTQTYNLEVVYLSPKKEVLPTKPNRSHYVSLTHNRIYVTKRKQIPLCVRLRKSSYSSPHRLVCRLLHSDGQTRSGAVSDTSFKKLSDTVVFRLHSTGQEIPLSADGFLVVVTTKFFSECRLFVEFLKSPSDFKQQHFRLRFNVEEISAPRTQGFDAEPALQLPCPPIFSLPIYITGHTSTKLLHSNNETVFIQGSDGNLKVGQEVQYSFDNLFGTQSSMKWVEFKRRFQPLITPGGGIPCHGKEELFEFTVKFLLQEKNDQIQKENYLSLRKWIGDDDYWLAMLLEITNKSYATKGWFHGRVPEAESNTVLQKQDDGTFLVRLSCSMWRSFVFCCRDKNSSGGMRKLHFQFRCIPGSNHSDEKRYVYIQGGRTYTSLDDAINHELRTLKNRYLPRQFLSRIPKSLSAHGSGVSSRGSQRSNRSPTTSLPAYRDSTANRSRTQSALASKANGSASTKTSSTSPSVRSKTIYSRSSAQSRTASTKSNSRSTDSSKAVSRASSKRRRVEDSSTTTTTHITYRAKPAAAPASTAMSRPLGPYPHNFSMRIPIQGYPASALAASHLPVSSLAHVPAQQANALMHSATLLHRPSVPN